MDTPPWTRPRLKPRLGRVTPIVAIASCGAAFAVGMLARGEASSTMLVPIVAPVVTPVNLTVAPPPPLVAAPTPVPAPVEPAPPPAPPRATAPHLAAQCLITLEGEAADPTCSWDEGFPAISADGALIATKAGVDDAGRGYPGESIHLLDARTGKLVRDLPILSPSEYDPDPAALAKLRVKIITRAHAAQRTLDARKFRTMLSLGNNDAYHEEIHFDATKIHAEFAGTTVRLIDPATATELGRHEFGVAPPKVEDPDSMCGSLALRWLGVWWDPATKAMLGVSDYRTGGCMCPDASIEQVVRLP
jgi:hypothetical protein